MKFQDEPQLGERFPAGLEYDLGKLFLIGEKLPLWKILQINLQDV